MKSAEIMSARNPNDEFIVYACTSPQSARTHVCATTYNIDSLCTVMLVSGIILQIYEFMFLYGDAGVIWL